MQEYSDKCNKCSLCHLIDVGNLPSLKIIRPDGTLIKKQQLVDLKNDFSKSSQYTNKKIYIIVECEKMNKDASNTILKFLEEPIDEIYGFFITNQYDSILSTIQSRCQHIKVDFKNVSKSLDNIDIIYKYLYSIEVEKKEQILYNKTYFNGFEREDIIHIFKSILKIYDCLLNDSNLFNKEYEIFNFLKKLSNQIIVNRIKKLSGVLDRLNSNANIEMVLDWFILEMDGDKRESI